MKYAIINRVISIELEKYEDEKWEVFKPVFEKKENLIYASSIINDEKLIKIVEENNIKEIIWDRIYNQFTKKYHKILIDWNPNNFDKMAEDAKQKIIEIEEKILLQHEEQKKLRHMNFIARIEKNRPSFEMLLKQTEEMNKKIPMELTDKEALDKWRSLNYYMPAGDRIRKIKIESNLSWTEFEHQVKLSYGDETTPPENLFEI